MDRTHPIVSTITERAAVVTTRVLGLKFTEISSLLSLSVSTYDTIYKRAEERAVNSSLRSLLAAIDNALRLGRPQRFPPSLEISERLL